MIDSNTPPLLVITGPTASGKSAVAIRFAEALGGEIVNIDSVQVYRGANIGSAKIESSEQELIPHHLIDIREPDDPIDVAQFRALALAAIEEIQGRGKPVILVGGTTLYLKALFHGLTDLPAGDDEFRELAEARTSEDLYEELRGIDPESALELNQADRLRVIRALEIFHLTGTPLSKLNRKHGFSDAPFCALFLFLSWSRETLYERINERAHAMIRDGLINETKGLIEKYGSELRLLRSLGYAEVVQHLAGTISADKVSEEIALHTRRFAKRQLTFWRNEPGKLGWVVRPDENIARIESEGQKEFSTLSDGFEELVPEIQKRFQESFPRNELWYLEAGSL